MTEPKDLKTAIDLIEQICDVMENRDLSEVEISHGDFSVKVCRGGAAPIIQPTIAPIDQEIDDDTILIRSPMPGMFYRAPSPEDPSFVEIGDTIARDDTLCLIEAMKIFSEVKSDFPCEIVEILTENAAAIEFDQPLFRVRKI